ncbi:hypothetical protein DL93DRAFT_2055292 [Clavulina sp. PMI_390]|nr:hypothetical protein DL93DRAFT_2055292 [Clavulina sp. PMI_390]
MENISFQNGPPALIQPPNHVAAQNYSSHTAVIALPGQPPPFGPLFYSSSGFDMIGVLTRVASRKNPQVILGPVDFTCSFVVSDAQAPDEPIVYASPTFSELTGYDMNEIVGRNCRFLQSPTGRVRKGETRRYTDDKGVAHIRKSIDNVQECQVSFLNYKKNGEAFVNLVTIIPIPWDTDEIKYLIGFQVDLERQPGAILRMMGDGSYAVNYSSVADPFPPMSDKLKNVLGLNGTAEAARNKFNEFILDHSDDFIHVVSLKGAFQYVSPSVTAVLGYAPEDLAGKNIADIAHPADLVPVQRELKESTAQVQPPSLVSSSTLAQHYLSQAKLVHLLYRVKAKNGTFVWLEATGRLHVESSKGRKSIVFSGRVRRQPVLHWSSVVPDGVGLPPPGSLVHQPQNSMVDCWAHVGIDTGLLLYISSGGQTVLGRPPREMDGTALRDWVAPAWQITIDTALADARRKLEENQIIIESGVAPTPSPPISNGTPSDTPDSVMATANGNGVGSLDSASTVIPHTISTTYNGGESGETINAPRILSASLQANIFEELEIAKGSSWQYELQQLRMENGRLQKEIDDAIRQQRNGNGAVIEGASAGSISSSSSKSTVVPGPMPR